MAIGKLMAANLSTLVNTVNNDIYIENFENGQKL
jgi:hypothetical protein